MKRIWEIPVKEIILDMDSSDSPTFGKQEGSAYNGHFGYTCYHPLFVFNQFGDMERALLRKCNVCNSGRLLWNYRYRTEKNMFFNRVYGNSQLVIYDWQIECRRNV